MSRRWRTDWAIGCLRLRLRPDMRASQKTPFDPRMAPGRAQSGALFPPIRVRVAPGSVVDERRYELPLAREKTESRRPRTIAGLSARKP